MDLGVTKKEEMEQVPGGDIIGVVLHQERRRARPILRTLVVVARPSVMPTHAR